MKKRYQNTNTATTAASPGQSIEACRIFSDNFCKVVPSTPVTSATWVLSDSGYVQKVGATNTGVSFTLAEPVVVGAIYHLTIRVRETVNFNAVRIGSGTGATNLNLGSVAPGVYTYSILGLGTQAVLNFGTGVTTAVGAFRVESIVRYYGYNLLQSDAALKPMLVGWPKGGRKSWAASHNLTMAGGATVATISELTYRVTEGTAEALANFYRQSQQMTATNAVLAVDIRPSGVGQPRSVIIRCNENTVTRASILYHPSTRTLTTPWNVIESGIVELEDGWVRVWVKCANVATAFRHTIVITRPENTSAYTGDGVSGVEVRNFATLAENYSYTNEVYTSDNVITSSLVPTETHLLSTLGTTVLPVTLPATQYLLGTLGVDGTVIFTAVDSDGTTPINVINQARQKDWGLAQGGDTPKNRHDIIASWEL